MTDIALYGIIQSDVGRRHTAQFEAVCFIIGTLHVLQKGGIAMRLSLDVVLTWADRIATVVKIAVPAIRRIASELDAAKAETAHARMIDA